MNNIHRWLLLWLYWPLLLFDHVLIESCSTTRCPKKWGSSTTEAASYCPIFIGTPCSNSKMYICFLLLSILYSLHQWELQILLSKGKLLWKYYPWKYSMESALLSSIQCIHPCLFLWKHVLDTNRILENFQADNFGWTILIF